MRTPFYGVRKTAMTARRREKNITEQNRTKETIHNINVLPAEVRLGNKRWPSAPCSHASASTDSKITCMAADSRSRTGVTRTAGTGALPLPAGGCACAGMLAAAAAACRQAHSRSGCCSTGKPAALRRAATYSLYSSWSRQPSAGARGLLLSVLVLPCGSTSKALAGATCSHQTPLVGPLLLCAR